jgi:hypothetical protein
VNKIKYRFLVKILPDFTKTCLLLQAATNNVTQCCIEQNVTAGCMDACSFFLDIDAVIDKPECISDFDKLMKCAAGNGISYSYVYKYRGRTLSEAGSLKHCNNEVILGNSCTRELSYVCLLNFALKQSNDKSKLCQNSISPCCYMDQRIFGLIRIKGFSVESCFSF